VKRTLDWLRRWGISFASLLSGLATLFVFRRELPHVRWIVGYLLLLWLLFAVMIELRQSMETRAGRLVVTAADYTIQTLYHGVLLFLLPAYYASATIGSLNTIFLALLVALVLLATFDPWYQALVPRHPWLGLVFLVVSVFAALNVALPLVGASPYPALLLSAWSAVVALTPAVHAAILNRLRRSRWRLVSWIAALALTATAGVGAAALAHLVRAAIPPAPMALARATLARSVKDFEPIDPLSGPIRVQDLELGGVVAYTAVYAPAGLRQPIAHVWRHEGRVVDVVPLSPVHGGRRQGFRTYSKKLGFPADPTGRWSVEVVTTSGQLIGRLPFRVTP
jgi:hypothetical protein